MKEITYEEFTNLRGNERSLAILINKEFLLNPFFTFYRRGVISSNKIFRGVDNLFVLDSFFQEEGITPTTLQRQYKIYTLKSFDV